MLGITDQNILTCRIPFCHYSLILFEILKDNPVESELKFKDRDLINDQCCFWRSKDEFKIQEQWDIRSRQYLGARYDHKSGDYDWKLSMRYNELQASGLPRN